MLRMIMMTIMIMVTSVHIHHELPVTEFGPFGASLGDCLPGGPAKLPGECRGPAMIAERVAGKCDLQSPTVVSVYCHVFSWVLWFIRMVFFFGGSSG